MYRQALRHPYLHEGRRSSDPDQATLMADIEEMQKKRDRDDETLKKIKEQENVMSERKAAETATNPYDSPFIGRATEYADYHRSVVAGCPGCRTKNHTIADFSAKNASLIKDNEELRLQVLKLQDEVAMMEMHVHYDPYRRHL